MELVEGLGTVVDVEDLVPLGLQDDADHLGQRDVVIDDEDEGTHVTSVSRLDV